MDAGTDPEDTPVHPVRAARPAHSSRPLPRPSRRTAAGVGIAATVIAVAIGTTALIRDPGPTASGPRTVDAITVTGEPPAVLPLSDPEVLALLDRDPDFGALAAPGRRASCLAGLGYPAATRVLGAQPIEVHGRPAILLLLPGDSARTVIALAVAPQCSSADTGLLVNTSVARP
ncbi:hypothetical protein KIH27_09275 [Mycobacterium sp. M1]|uniref:Alanine rich protein n=1 Tax=Mycolicibacter acidiphilus TaxID=2835306 RepID=A0ABS5RHV3_9MYCO|nr:hypothetical protein [Mycolicibacter acidiphilus]MBS9533774.1 hypothetical protein [Mycolicibacter acidiphilus]